MNNILKSNMIMKKLLGFLDFFYSAISILILIIHPSYDNPLSRGTIITQFFLGLGVIGSFRIMLRIYWFDYQFGRLRPYIRLVLAEKFEFVKGSKVSIFRGDNACIRATDAKFISKKQLILDYVEDDDNKNHIAHIYSEKSKEKNVRHALASLIVNVLGL